MENQMSRYRRTVHVVVVISALLLSLPAVGQATANPAAASQKLPQDSASDLTVLADAIRLYRNGKLDQAIEKYQGLLKQNPPLPEAYAGLARTFLKRGKVAEAYEAVQKGRQVAPNSDALQVALGEVHFRQGNIAQAEREWLSVVNRQPDARALLGIARASESYSLYRRAKVAIDEAHRLDPGDPEIHSFWMGTLKLSERIKALENYIAGANDDDVETRKRKVHYLEMLKARAAAPQHGCRLTTSLTSTEADLKAIMYNPKQQRGFGLNVSLNGQKALLLLDTGAGGITINRRIAERAGLKKLEESTTGGIGDEGSVRSWSAYAESIQIGNLQFQDCLVDVIDKSSVLDDDGLIGADVFAAFLVDIDFPDRKLKLSELPRRPEGTSHDSELRLSIGTQYANEDGSSKLPDTNGLRRPESIGPQDAYVAPEMTAYTHVFRFGHLLLIPTRVGETTPKLFLIDTGADKNAITPQAAREVTKIADNPSFTVKGLSGEVKNVFQADKVVIQFAHLKQENQAMIAHDLSGVSNDIGVEVSGMLGFNLMNMLDLKIDYRDGLVNFTYIPRPRIEKRQ
jgi:tetratricopeptide (TPR) repeat protein